MANIEYSVIIIGAGGTGGNFAKEFARYMRYFFKPGRSIKTILVDGDRIEKKNTERQPFLKEDLEQNKAMVLSEAILENFELAQWMSYPHYIDSAEQLEMLFKKIRGNDGDTFHMPMIVGCVDNHRARQCMEKFFEKQDNCIYIDSANEFSVGEVVIGVRLEGKELAPARSFYYPDVLTDEGPSASELSCGGINQNSPQHLATNLMAANLILSSVVSVISEDELKGGIIYFDRKKYFSRFLPYQE